MRKYLIILLLTLLCACASVYISEKEANKVAEDFVKEEVTFYTEDSNASAVVSASSIKVEIIDSYRNGEEWIIKTHVYDELQQKKRGLSIKLNARTGEVKKIDVFTI